MKEGTRNYFTKMIDIEMRDSVINIMKQYLTIDVWDYSMWGLNKYVGSKQIELISIIKGNVDQKILIEGFGEDGKTSNFIDLI